MRLLITHMHHSMGKEMGETEPGGAEWGAEETPSSRDVVWEHKPGWDRCEIEQG